MVEYKGEYHEKHPTIQAFWKAFFELNDDEKKVSRGKIGTFFRNLIFLDVPSIFVGFEPSASRWNVRDQVLHSTHCS